MDIYTKQGNIIREQPNADGTTIVELEFLLEDLFWSRLFGIAIFYLAFKDRLGIDYVMANARGTRAAVLQADFDGKAREVLIATLLEVRGHANELLGTAQRYLIDQPPSGALDINHRDELRRYEKLQLECLAFVEQLTLRLPAPA